MGNRRQNGTRLAHMVARWQHAVLFGESEQQPGHQTLPLRHGRDRHDTVDAWNPLPHPLLSRQQDNLFPVQRTKKPYGSLVPQSRLRPVRQLTKSLPVSLDTSSFVSPTNVSYKSVDGKAIPALLYKPGSERGKGKPPAIVYVHGGPTAQFMNSWNPLVQEYLDQGFIVIAPNYRGSTGYGRDFREANRFVMGQLDLADVVKGAEYLSKNSLADPARIGITGGSFGGYLTMCALARYPSLWAAGSAIVPFLNWIT